MTLVITPRSSEKSYAAASVENGVYTFVVPKSTNKHEVKTAVEKLYEVTVTNVNISILRAKLSALTKSVVERALAPARVLRKLMLA